ncbi:hypothetical protein [Pseudoclavibacter sp. VKM Ac-2867]|uniref:hypothetical protein n=1 Tax=Pseudoclavibacter sp. VKM Ac-2867 TaxID=2783829 RepID=UPI00188C8872|nr:hypothetical protein [Pseudoclavibacter sp. VKM Ac-2867]MBF4457436.1 hypothetical protein [Pseudoclavibacter sp. VKM Ac-2867]
MLRKAAAHLSQANLKLGGSGLRTMIHPLIRELAAKTSPVRVPVAVTCRVLKIARLPHYR